jgi:predicted GTPase
MAQVISASPRSRSTAALLARERVKARDFVLFTTGFLDPGYRRYIQRRLREIYGFEGSPIVLNMRVRGKRRR